jgi:tyrosinase
MRIWFLLITLAGVVGNAVAQSVDVQLATSRSQTTYFLCWAPIEARIKLAPSSGDVEKIVDAEVEQTADGGAIGLQISDGPLTTASIKLETRISLRLTSATWTRFWVAGVRPSRVVGDVKIVLRDATSGILTTIPLMIRVRKNADALTAVERGRFLAALQILHTRAAGAGKGSEFSAFARVHEVGGAFQVHRSPLFLPWHRALLLDFERRLQEIDPAVAVPYWRYDKPSTAIFTSDFLGETIPAKDFSPGTGLANWSDPILGKINRVPVTSPSDGVLDEAVPGQFNDQFVIFHSQLESQFHNGVHSRVGGWLALPSSPADPLFFLLHANVDRVWAHWQARNGRFSSDESSYSAQGSHPGVGEDAGLSVQGVPTNDSMWPWRDQAPAGSGAGSSIVRRLPAGPGPETLTPASVIDFMNTRGSGDALGYCYDDLPFADSPPP